MEQQQCPICMLFLLPGMNLQDHLETHPKDMIIKALLSVKTESPKPVPTPVSTSSNEMTTLFLTTPFNSTQTHIYQPQQQQQQHQHQQQQNATTTYTVAKRNSGNNNNNNNTVLLGNRPYRLTLDSSQSLSSPITSSSAGTAASTTTFLNAQSTSSSPSAVALNNNNINNLNNNSSYGRRTATTNDGDLFPDNSKTAFRCIQQNTEQKNIMIVNTSSTQFSIQQTLPMKKQSTSNAAIELHPVIIDNSTLPLQATTSSTNNNAISIIPRYTSEKYSGPPPSYESSVTNTINDKQSRVIDLTQTMSATAMKMMEKQCFVGNNNSSNHTNKLTTLSGNGADENRHLMITTTAPQKILEYTQTENGDFMITEKLLSTSSSSSSSSHQHHQQNQNHHQQQPTTNCLNLSHDDEMVEEINDNDGYDVKYVQMDEPLTFNISSDNGKYHHHHHHHHHHNQEDQFTVIEESMDQINNFNESQESSSCSNVIETSSPTKKSGVKVISNVKLTSAEMFSPSIKDIIKHYNSNNSNNKQTENEIQIDQSVVDVHANEDDEMETDNDEETIEVQNENEATTSVLIQCTETLNLSKDKDDDVFDMTNCTTTSVIRKTTIAATSSNEAGPSSSSSVSKPENKEQQNFELEPSTSAECLRKPINVVFNSNPTNRLKQKEIYKKPKKLVLKLKKPLSEVEKAGECSSSTTFMAMQSVDSKEVAKIKDETIECEAIKTSHMNEDETDVDGQSVQQERNTSTPVCKVESSEQFTVTFLDQHDYEPINKITVSPEIHHDSETNQSVMSMDLEPETSIVKREQIDSELPIIVKTEMNSCSASSHASNSQTSSCSRSPGPSRQNLESVNSINETSPINFLYQNDRVRFSPPLSPYVYMKTFSSCDDPPKQETDASWNNSSSIVTQNSDQNSTCSRYTPSFDDNRSSYTDLDVKISRNEISIRGSHSTDSLNIRTDEKMPARGEISEQESNGEIEQPWHHPYFQLQAFPSSYDMHTAQECWNLSKADSQNACDSNNIQNVIINFPPLNGQEDIKAPDLLKTIMQTVTKQEPSGINDEASGSNSNIIVKKNRSFRCPECSKVFMKLRARNRHMDQEHPHFRRVKKIKAVPTATQTSKSESASVFSTAAASSSSALVNWTSGTTTSTEEQEVKVLSIIKHEPSTSAAVLVKNEMNRMLISTTGSIKMEMDRLLLEPSTSATSQQISTLGLKIKRTYMCAKCNEQFRTLKLLDKHFQIHPAECTLCQKTFNSWNTFSLHLKHHLNIRVHACRYCPKRFVQRQRLVEHERIHTGHMPIKCPDCDERFRRYSNMLHHRARVHLNKKAKQEDYVCDCGEILQTKAKLEWHQETHENKPKPCPYCRERFTHRNSLTRHIRLSHTEKYVFVKSKAVKCPICNCTYLPSSIKAHMATHQLSNKEFSCSICSKQFSTKWNLKQHHWTHANRSSKPFQCNVCPSAFVRETDYTTHMNAHRSIKPFTCNTCGKRFVRKYNWLRHSREHEREKKFTCEICNKKFHRAYYLTEHKRVHTGERPFSCTICGKTSATKTNHNKHIKIHHARDPLTAEG